MAHTIDTELYRFTENEPHERGFAKVFDEEILPVLKEAELTRRRMVFKLQKRLGIASVVVLAWLLGAELMWGVGAMPLATIVGLSGLAVAIMPAFRYQCFYKREVYPVVARHLGLEYFPDGLNLLNMVDVKWTNRYISRLTFLRPHASGVLPFTIGLTGEDGFKGTFNGIPLAFEEIHMLGDRSVDLTFGFRAIAVLVTLPAQLGNRVFVKADRGFANWTHGKFPGMDTIRFDDDAFEEQYEVFAEDEAEARALLTPEARRILTEVAHLFGKSSIKLSFRGQEMFMVIPVRHNLFEVTTMFRSALLPGDIRLLLKKTAMLEQLVAALGRPQSTTAESA
ncbi:MAG: DUF3137 domain-containing protein [Proteobacteria bacterium]|nr:DUF3137 domain-containing protein [Pseudomonadota bacterium]